MLDERLQKILAAAGLASRRQAEVMITEGQVTVNGRKAKVGDKADPETDSIKVSGRLLKANTSKANRVYFAFNKPRGVICTNDDPEGRKRLFDFINAMKTFFELHNQEAHYLVNVMQVRDISPL